MKKFSAQYIITNSGPALKRGIITVDNEGRILGVDDTKGNLKETHSVEFFNGIIVPGFVNCHCHLELSHMKGLIKPGNGLPEFISRVRSERGMSSENLSASAFSADTAMFRNGISLCADICNTDSTFGIKKKSSISYINLIEVFGIDPSGARKRADEALSAAGTAARLDLQCSIVPHSVYSVSRQLFRIIAEEAKSNSVTSVHFMESPEEKDLIEKHAGSLMDSYKKSGLLNGEPDFVPSHEDAILNYITQSGNLLLVHNTFVNEEIIRKVKKRKNLYWCLCPNSNLYIEKKIPPVDLLLNESCDIVIGTDSLASNKGLDILEELKTLQSRYPYLTLEELIRWASLNGAKALCREDEFGSIAPGKKPGLILLEDADLTGMKLTNETSVRRIV